MPDLFKEMKADLENEKMDLVREFFVLSAPGVAVGSPDKHFRYDLSRFEGLAEKIKMLEHPRVYLGRESVAQCPEVLASRELRYAASAVEALSHRSRFEWRPHLFLRRHFNLDAAVLRATLFCAVIGDRVGLARTADLKLPGISPRLIRCRGPLPHASAKASSWSLAHLCCRCSQ